MIRIKKEMIKTRKMKKESKERVTKKMPKVKRFEMPKAKIKKIGTKTKTKKVVKIKSLILSKVQREIPKALKVILYL